MSNLISMDKKYKTRDGLEVRVLCIDNYYNDSGFPVIALVEGETATYTETGSFYSYREDESDLIEVPDEKELWLEFYSYEGGDSCCTVGHTSKQLMTQSISDSIDCNNGYKLIATKKITIVEGGSCL